MTKDCVMCGTMCVCVCTLHFCGMPTGLDSVDLL